MAMHDWNHDGKKDMVDNFMMVKLLSLSVCITAGTAFGVGLPDIVQK